MYHLLRYLATRHRVALVTYAHAGEVEALAHLRWLGLTVHAVPSPGPISRRDTLARLHALLHPSSMQARWARAGALRHAVRERLAGEPFDLVQVEMSRLGSLRFDDKTPVILDTHNVDYEIRYRTARVERSPARKLHNWVEARKLRAEEHRLWQRLDGCVVTSERERALVRQVAPGTPLAVVPNAVDLAYFQPGPAPVHPARLVFVGLLSYRPNADAVQYFVHDILPRIAAVRPDVEFEVIGRDASPELLSLASPQVRFSGPVPDVRPYLAGAVAVVVPLRSGSGTRLKVLEGLAMARPLVSTSLGCEGIAVRDGKHLLVADDPAAFAEAVLRVLSSPSLAADLSRAGRSLMEREYGWTTAGQQLEAFHSQVLAASVRSLSTVPDVQPMVDTPGRAQA